MLKSLKLMREQGSHGKPGVLFPVSLQTLVDGRSKRIVIGVKGGLQTLLLDENFQTRSIRFKLGEYDGKYIKSMPNCLARLRTRSHFLVYRALSSTNVTG